MWMISHRALQMPVKWHLHCAYISNLRMQSFESRVLALTDTEALADTRTGAGWVVSLRKTDGGPAYPRPRFPGRRSGRVAQAAPEGDQQETKATSNQRSGGGLRNEVGSECHILSRYTGEPNKLRPDQNVASGSPELGKSRLDPESDLLAGGDLRSDENPA